MNHYYGQFPAAPLCRRRARLSPFVIVPSLRTASAQSAFGYLLHVGCPNKRIKACLTNNITIWWIPACGEHPLNPPLSCTLCSWTLGAVILPTDHLAKSSHSYPACTINLSGTEHRRRKFFGMAFAWVQQQLRATPRERVNLSTVAASTTTQSLDPEFSRAVLPFPTTKTTTNSNSTQYTWPYLVLTLHIH